MSARRFPRTKRPLRAGLAFGFALAFVFLFVACDAANSLVGGECAQALTACSPGECVDLLSDPGNCGACGKPCKNGVACGGGVCGGAIDGSLDGQNNSDGALGDGQLGDGQLSDGQSSDGQSSDGQSSDGSKLDGSAGDGSSGDACVPPFNTAAHCGACNIQCVGVNHVCSPSDGGFACGPFCTNPLFPDECAGTCVDLQNDPTNCGVCGKSCASGICTAGICQGSTPGDIVLIGHDFTGSVTSTTPGRLLANATFIPSTNPLRILSYEQYAAAGAVTVAKNVINASAVSRGRAAVKYTVSNVAANLAVPGLEAKFDVILVHDQGALPLAQAAIDGANDAAALLQFTKAGGVIVVLSGANGQDAMPTWISSAGLVSLAGDTFLPTTPPPATRGTVIAPGDDVGTLLVSPYAVGTRSVSFQSNEPDGANVTFVVLTGSAPGPLGDPIVIHKTVP